MPKTQTVTVDGVGDFEFPEGMPRDKMASAIKKYMASRQQATPTPTPEVKRIGPAPEAAPATAKEPDVAKGFGQRFQAFGQSVSLSAWKSIGSLAMQGLRFSNLIGRAVAEGPGYMPSKDDPVDRTTRAIEKHWSDWLESTRTTPRSPAEGAAELTGSVLGGMAIPIPGVGEAKAGVGIIARAGQWLGKTLAGAAALEAIAKLPDVADAQSWDETKQILSDVPSDIATNVAISAGMMGASAMREHYSNVLKRKISTKETAAISKAAAEDQHPPVALVSPEADIKQRLDTSISAHESAKERLAEATRRVGIMPEVEAQEDPRMMPKKIAPLLQTEQPPTESGAVVGLRNEATRLRGEADRLKSAVGQHMEAGPPDTGVGTKRSKNVPKDESAWRSTYKRWQKAEQEARRAERRADAAERPTPVQQEGILKEREDALQVQREALGLEKKTRAQREKAQAEFDRVHGEGKSEKPVETAIDEAHADRVADRGIVEAKKSPVVMLTNRVGKFKAYWNQIFNAPRQMPADARRVFDVDVIQNINRELFDAARAREAALVTIPDPAARRQATRYIEGKELDPKGPALTQEQLEYLGEAKALQDAAFERSVKAGTLDEDQYLDNYIIHRFENQKAVREFFAKRGRVDPDAPFSQKRVFHDYEIAKKAGFKPVTEDFADLHYMTLAQYARANYRHQFVETLKNMPQAMIPRKVSPMRPEGFRGVNDPDLLSFWVQKDVARVLDHWSEPSFFDKEAVRPIAKPVRAGVAGAKKLTVALGGFHYYAEFRHALASGYYRPGGWRMGDDLIKKGDPMLRELVAHNLNLGGTPDIGRILETQRADWNILGKLSERLFHHLWKEYVPGWKAFIGHEYARKMIETHPEWPLEKVYDKVAYDVNNLFGVKNYEQYARSKTLRDTMQTFMFAPDWIETRLSLFANVGKEIVTGETFRRGEGFQSKAFISHLIGTAVVTEIMHQAMWALSGESPPKETGRKMGQFSIPWVKDSRGKPIMFDSMLYMRMPYDIVTDPIKFLQNRESPVLSTLWEEITNRDFRGEPIRRPEATPYRKGIEMFKHMTGRSMPIIIQHLYGALSNTYNDIDNAALSLQRGLGAYFGMRSHTDYPIDIRIKLESQMRNEPATRARIKLLQSLGDMKGAEDVRKEFNDRADDLETQVNDDGWNETLGPYLQKNRRFLRITH